MAADQVLIAAITSALADAADPARAPKMQAYMKSAMPYLGVPVPSVRTIVRAEAKQRPPGSRGELAATVRGLWRPARFREERYAASALLDVPAARPLRSPALLALYRELIVSGAWWDHVDELAHRVGELLAAYPDVIRPEMLRWQGDPDRWLRRVSIICQLGAKSGTDLELLAGAIDANAADRDFFIRKAIGWALREYARTDADWVRDFLASRGERLSALSQREAIKHIGR